MESDRLLSCSCVQAAADAAVATYMARLSAIEFTLADLCVISRTQTSPFVVKHRVALGSM